MTKTIKVGNFNAYLPEEKVVRVKAKQPSPRNAQKAKKVLKPSNK